MDWVDHDRLGFNYRLTEMQAALGDRPARAPRRAARGARATVASLYSERLAELDYGAPAGEGDPAGLLLPCADREPERRSWFVYAVRLPAGADRDAVVADLAQRGVEAKAYMPCIHLMPHYPRALRLPRRASSRSPRTHRRGCSPCRSSPRSQSSRSTGSARRSPRPCAATGPERHDDPGAHRSSACRAGDPHSNR